MSDNAKAENSKDVQDILRQYMIMDANSEPKYQNKNTTEHHIQDVKNMTTTMMERKWKSNYIWSFYMIYCCYILNHLSHPQYGE